MQLAEPEHNGKCVRTKQSTLRTIIINNRSIPTFVPLLIALPLLLACTAVFAAHTYTIAVDDTLETLTVEARFDRSIDDISARSRYAASYLRDATDCDSGEKLESRSRKLVLPTGGIRCLRYTVDLGRAARADRFASIVGGGSVAVSPTLWMWRPRLLSRDEILATFKLAGGGQVFVPWQMMNEEGTYYRLKASPQSGTAIAVFGSFQQSIEHVAGADLRVVMLDTRDKIDLQPLIPWVRATAENVAATYGRFPNPNASILLIPSGGQAWGSDSAVSFGRLVRDGGETIELMINQNRPIGEFYKEWTPTHEFSHLMLPYVDQEQRWISEGFAQYYQNVLLARAKQQSVEHAWQKIYDGLERGRESAPGMSPNDAATGSMRNTRMKVYWSGASIALMADVELRLRSNGKESLDTVLGRLQQCCLPSASSWSGKELFGKLDQLLEQPLFLDLYRQYADADDFPDARPLLARLGVSLRDGQIAIDPTAELSDIRDAITYDAMTHHDTEPH
jgi:hypothetical protein